MASAPPLTLLYAVLARQGSGWPVTRLWSRVNKALPEPSFWSAEVQAANALSKQQQQQTHQHRCQQPSNHDSSADTVLHGTHAYKDRNLVPLAALQTPAGSSMLPVHLAASRQLATSSRPNFNVLVSSAATLQELVAVYETYHRPMARPQSSELGVVGGADGSDMHPTGSSHGVPAPLKLNPKTLCTLCRRAASLLTQLLESPSTAADRQARAGDRQGRTRVKQAGAAADSIRDYAHELELVQLLLSSTAIDLAGQIDSLPMYQLDLLLVAWADTGFDPGELLRAEVMWQLRPDAGNRMSHADSVQLASLAWSLQRLGWLGPELLPVLGSAVLRRARGFGASSLALLSRALYAAGVCDEQVLLQLGKAALQRMPELSVEEVLHVLDAVSKAGSSSEAFLMAAADHLTVAKVKGCSPRQVAALASVYARVGLMHTMLLERLAASATFWAGKMDLPQVSTLIHSFAQLNTSQDDMHAALCGRALQILQRWLSAQGNTSQSQHPQQSGSFLKPGLTGAELEDNQAPALSAADLAALASALSLSAQVDAPTAAERTADTHPKAHTLLGVVADAAVLLASDLDAQGLGDVCWLLHQARYHHPDLLSAASQRVQQLVAGLSGPSEQLGTPAPDSSGASFDTSINGSGHTYSYGTEGTLFNGKASLSQQAMWGLVKTLAYLASFDIDCRPVLDLLLLHPALVAELQQLQPTDFPPSYTSQISGWTQPAALHPTPFTPSTPTLPGKVPSSEQRLLWLCALLDPLAQQLQHLSSSSSSGMEVTAVGAEAGPGQAGEALWRYAQPALAVLQAVSAQVQQPQDLQPLCVQQVIRAFVALGDAGWRHEVETSIGEGLMAALAEWEQRDWQAAQVYRRRQQQSLKQSLLQMGVQVLSTGGDTAQEVSVTRGLLSPPMVLAQVGANVVALDVCGPSCYAVNAGSDGAWSSFTRGGEGAGARRGLGGGQAGLVPAPGYAAHMGLGFRARALALRDWVPVLLPHWEWEAVVGMNPGQSRAYLERAVFAALQQPADGTAR